MWAWYFYSAFGSVPIVVTGCVVARDIYQGGAVEAQAYNSGQKTAEVYLPGMKTGQAGC